jgi:hypothetical protein
LLAQPLLLASGPSIARRREEEFAAGLLAELMDENAKAAWSVAEAPGGFGGGETVDEEGPEGFVLSVGGVGWLVRRSLELSSMLRGCHPESVLFIDTMMGCRKREEYRKKTSIR